MTKEIELAKQHGIQYRLTPEGTTEMWCHDRNVQAFAEALVADERFSRCMFVARLEHMQANGDKWLTTEAVLALLNDCDMLAASERAQLNIDRRLFRQE
jgi:hypothetical protein